MSADIKDLPILEYLRTTFQRERIRMGNRVAAVEQGRSTVNIATIERYCERFQALEKEVTCEIAQAVKDHEMWSWLERVKGIGPGLAGCLLAHINIERCNTVSGLWKYCFPPGAMVQTGTGAKPIESLALSDLVYGGDGKLHEITRLMSRPFVGQMVTIKARKMLDLRCTDNHPILVARVSERRYWPDTQQSERRFLSCEWKPASEVSIGDFMVVPKLKTKEVGIDTEMAYFFGRYVADGSTTMYQEDGDARGYTYVSFGHHEDDDLARMKKTAESIATATVLTMRSEKVLRFGRTTVAKRFKEMFGYSAETKRIPVDVMCANDNVSRAFLCGYFDGDGCAVQRNDKTYIHSANTISLGLALQLQLLGGKLGALPSLRFEERHDHVISGRLCNIQDRWHVDVAGGDAPAIFNLPNEGNRRAAIYYQDENFYYVPVVNVTSVPFIGTVYDLTCDGHTFLVSNMVVHNCGLAVTAGVADRPTKGQKLPYNAELKRICYLIGTSFLRSGSAYRDEYDRAKAFYQGNRPDWSPKRIDMAARRKMIKLFLSHLYCEWRTRRGLPVREPYAMQVLNHDGYKHPSDYLLGM